MTNTSSNSTNDNNNNKADTAAITPPPQTIADYDPRSSGYEWVLSFTAAMVPFTAFCFSHSRGLTVKAVESIAHSRFPGPAGLLALPFLTLGMEKCIYDTTQAIQGINPNVRPADRGGFPSGGADLPSFSLVPVMKRPTAAAMRARRRLTTTTSCSSSNTR